MEDKRREQATQRQARASNGRFLSSPGKKTIPVRVYGEEDDMDWFADLPTPADRGRVVRAGREVVGDE